jgi:hypothetical protein
MEREAAHIRIRTIADGSEGRSSSEGVRGVFDENPRSLDLREVYRKSSEVHRDEPGERLIIHQSVECLDIEVTRGWIDVEEYWLCSDVANTVRAGHERECRSRHAVTWPESGGGASCVERRGAVAEGNCEAGAGDGREALFKICDCGPTGQPVRPQDCGDRRNVIVIDPLVTVRDETSSTVPG